MWITDCGKFLKRREYQPTLPASWDIYMQIKKQQLEPDMEQGTCSKLGKEYIKVVYWYPAYLTYIQSSPCEMLGWMTHRKIKDVTKFQLGWRGLGSKGGWWEGISQSVFLISAGSQPLLSTYCVLDTILGAGNTAGNKIKTLGLKRTNILTWRNNRHNSKHII